MILLEPTVSTSANSSVRPSVSTINNAKPLLGVGNDAKTVKGQKFGYLTGILYLTPHKGAGFGNLCPHAVDCIVGCLNTAGRGTFNSVQAARLEKTQQFFKDNAGFMARLERDIARLEKSAKRKAKRTHRKVTPCVRLNGTSDVAWERLGVIQKFPQIQFYDYTKSPIRMLQYLSGKMPANYHLTFSRSSLNESQALDILSRGGNVAVVFRKTLPDTWNGYRVINGDLSDLRFHDGKDSDGRGLVVGLSAKGPAKKDRSGFVVDIESTVPVSRLIPAAPILPAGRFSVLQAA